MKCLFFSYSLPAEPSKARVYVWRQLKKLGAVNVQSIWVVPYSPERMADMKKLIDDIDRFKGESLLIDGKAAIKAQAERIQTALMESRNEEYGELIEKCEAYFKEIAYEIERKNFIFAEVEENEEELEKLKKWLKKVEKRDVIKTPMRKLAIEKIRTCEKLFEDFARKVFTHSQGLETSQPSEQEKAMPKEMVLRDISDGSEGESESSSFQKAVDLREETP